MGDMTGFTLTGNNRLMTFTALPIAIDIVTTQAEGRFILQQEGLALRTVTVMTGDAVKFGHRLMHVFLSRLRPFFIMAGKTESFTITGQKIRFS